MPQGVSVLGTQIRALGFYSESLSFQLLQGGSSRSWVETLRPKLAGGTERGYGEQKAVGITPDVSAGGWWQRERH